MHTGTRTLLVAADDAFVREDLADFLSSTGAHFWHHPHHSGCRGELVTGTAV